MNRRQRDDEVTLGKTVGVENKWGCCYLRWNIQRPG